MADYTAWRNMLYREVARTQTYGASWKEITVNTGGSDSTLQDIKVSNTSGGYAYQDSTEPNSAASNRFIYWRTTGDILELVEQSLDYNLVGSHVRYRFQDTPLLGGTSVHEHQGKVIILVTTVASVHRLVFPHPNKIHRPDTTYFRYSEESKALSVFTEASLTSAQDSKNFHMVNPGGSLTSQLHCAATCLNSEGQAVFAFATGLGTILLFCMPALDEPGEVTRFELCQSSMMQKLWSGWVPNIIKGNVEAAEKTLGMAMVTLDDEVFIFCVCKDHKLRWWSTKTHECVMVCNLLDFTPDRVQPQPPSVGAPGHTIKQVIREGNCYPLLCIHLCFPDRNQFCFLEPINNDGRYQIQNIGSLFGPAEDLTDFCVTSEHLWTLWSSTSGEPVARMAFFPSDQLPGKEWKDVILRPPETADLWIPSHRDPRDVYMEKIFYPGCFSVQDIIRALNVYRRSVHSRQENISMGNLKEEVTNAVEAEIRNAAMDYQLHEEEYCQLQLEHWAKFYSCCVQYQEVDSKCLGLFADNQSGLVCCIRKSHLTYFCPCDLIDELYLTDGSPAAATTLLETIGDSAEGHNVTDLLAVCQCLRLIADHISEDLGSQLEHKATVSQDLEEAAGSLVDSCLALDDLLMDDLNMYLESIHDLVKVVDVIAAHLNLSSLHIDNISLNESAGMVAQFDWAHLFAGSCGTSVIIAHMEHFVNTRFNASRDLLLLLLVAVRFGEQARYSGGGCWLLQTKLIPQVILNYRCYLVLKWIMSTVAMPNPANALEYNLTQLAALDISEAATQTTITLPHSTSGLPSMTLAQLFFQGTGGMHVRTTLMQGKLLDEDLPTIWTNALIPIIKILARLMWPVNSSFLFSEFLMGHCQYLHLQEYVRLLASWCTTNELSRKFLLGQCYLHFNEPYKAAQLFVEATEGLSTGEPFLIHKLLQVREETAIPLMEVNYYLKVINQFEQFQHPHLVITLAERAICVANKSDPNVATLYLKAFKYHLELGHYEEAYNAMVTNPDPSSRKDCLRQLLNVLCDRKQLQTLIQFPYIDLQEEMVSILENRARSADLSAHNYYDLLYSIHVSRNNFRRAGNVMYEHGLRLGQELPGIRGLQRQVQCYLAAMHALRLVKSEYAWVVKPIPRPHHMIRGEASATSPKHYLDGEEKLDSVVPKRCLEIVELAHLEKEYLLVDARLRLIKKDADLLMASGPVMRPDEMVGMLVSAGMFDRAIIICKAFNLKLNTVFENLALRCVTLAQCNMEDMNAENRIEAAWDWLEENELPRFPVAKEYSASDQAWLLLKTYLDKYEEPNGCYHRVTGIKLLSHDFPLPTWFVNPYKALDFAELLRLYIGFDKLGEAVSLALEYIEAVVGVLQGQGNQLYNLKGQLRHDPLTIWMPITSLDQMRKALTEHKDNGKYKELYNQLDNSIKNYQWKVEELSQMGNNSLRMNE